MGVFCCFTGVLSVCLNGLFSAYCCWAFVSLGLV